LAFTAKYHIRSVREYQARLAAFHARREYLSLPVNASRAYGLKWSKLLYSGGRFASYDSAAMLLKGRKITSRAQYLLVPGAERRKHKLPADMEFYREFPGWAAFRAGLAPSIERLREYCRLERIQTRREYDELAASAKGQGLFFPKNPPYAYGLKWPGWQAILFKAEKTMTWAERLRLLRERAARMRAMAKAA
jgi:hypothetical protein